MQASAFDRAGISSSLDMLNLIKVVHPRDQPGQMLGDGWHVARCRSKVSSPLGQMHVDVEWTD